MSKLSLKPIKLSGVKASLEENKINLTMGSNNVSIDLMGVSCKIDINNITNFSSTSKMLLGSVYSRVKNYVNGLISPFEISLILQGTGYKDDSMLVDNIVQIYALFY